MFIEWFGLFYEKGNQHIDNNPGISSILPKDGFNYQEVRTSYLEIDNKILTVVNNHAFVCLKSTSLL